MKKQEPNSAVKNRVTYFAYLAVINPPIIAKKKT